MATRVNIPGIGVKYFPDDISDEEISRKVSELRGAQATPKGLPPTEAYFDPKDQPLSEQFKGAAKRNIESIVGGVTDVLPAMAASKLGYEDYAKEQMEEYKQRMEAAEYEHPTAYRSYKDVQGISDVPGFVAESIGGAAPSIGAMLATSGAGALAARGLLGAGTAALGSEVGMGAGAVGLNTPEAFQQIYEDTGEMHPGIALAVGSVKGLLDTYLPSKVLRQLGVRGENEVISELIKKSDAVPGFWKQSIAGTAKTAAGEGLTESAQEALDIIGSKFAGSDQDPFSKENLDRVITSGLQGAIGGAAFGTPGAMAESRRVQTGVRDRLEAEREAAERAQAEGTATEEQKALLALPAPPPEAMRVSPTGEVFQSQQEADTEAFYKRYPHLRPGYEEPSVAPTETQPAGLLPAPQGPSDFTVGQQGEVFQTPEEAAAYREFQQRRAEGALRVDTAGLTPGQVEEYRAQQRTAGTPYAQDLFPAEKYLAELRGKRGERPGTVEESLAGPTQIKPVYSAVLDADTLQGIGLPTGSGLYKRLLNKDVRTPEGFEALKDVAEIAQTNKYIPDSTKQGLMGLYQEHAETNAPKEQSEIFGPRGGVLKGAAQRVPKNVPSEPSGVGVGVPSERGALPPEGVGQPEREGLGGPAPVPAPSGVGEGVSEPALTEEPAVPTTPSQYVEMPSRAEDLAAYPELGAPLDYDLGKDITRTKDDEKVQALLRSAPGKGNKEAQTYLSMQPKLVDSLDNIAFDLVNPVPKYRTAPEEKGLPYSKYHAGTGTKQAQQAAAWVRKNLSKKAAATLDALIVRQKKWKQKSEKFNAFREKENEQREAEAKYETNTKLREEREADSFVKNLDALLSKKYLPESTQELTTALHGKVLSALRDGNLSEALSHLSTTLKGPASRIAKLLSTVAKDTKVEVRPHLTNSQNKRVAGFFDPATNTIYISEEKGLSPHVLMHEAAHAVLSHVLDDPNHPLTRQLTQIFNRVKDQLDTDYGAQDVHEFASEAWGNEEFAAKLMALFPDSRPQSAWEMFTRAVANLFRRLMGIPTKPLTSVYDQVDKILTEIASPSPEFRNAQVLYAPYAGEHAFKGIDRAISSTPMLSDEAKANLSEGVKSGSASVRQGIFALMPMLTLSDMATPIFPKAAPEFLKLINGRGGYENSLGRGIDVVVELAKRAIATAPKDQTAFNELVNDSTLYEVDPTKPRSEYEGKVDESGNNLGPVWADLNSRYKKLNPVWQGLYTDMRNAYKKLYEEIKNSIAERIDASDIDPRVKASVKNDIMSKLAEQGVIEPYFALGREGSHWLSAQYTDKDGQPQFTVEAFKNAYQRQLRMQELEKEGAFRIEPYDNIADIDYRRAPSGSFVNSVLRIMETNGLPENAVEEMMRLFVATLPETSFAKSMQKRKKRLGFNTDTIATFERKARNTAHQIANMKYNPKLTKVVDDMRAHTIAVGKGEVPVLDKAGNPVMDAEGNPTFEPQRDNSTEAEYLREFEKHLRYVLNPTKHDIGSILSSVAFTYTLGFNISSALVNMANVPMIVAPYLKGKYADAEVTRAIGDATRVFMGSGRKAQMQPLGGEGKTVGMDVMPSIANYGPDTELGRKYATAIKVWGEQGQLNRSQLYEILRGDTRSGFLDKINAASGWAFHHGERMNREVTLIASYNLELNRLKKEGVPQAEAEERAANHAVYLAELTNGSIAAASAPRISHSAIGKMLFMYKRYGISMYFMLFKTAKEAFNKNLSPEERRAAWRQLGGIFGMSALMAGAQGVPLFGLASMVYGMFCDDDDDDLGTVTRKYMGDFFYKGPLEYMTGLSIAGRISLNDLIIRDTKEGTAASTFSQQMLQAMGGPVVGVADRIHRGYSKINEGNVERGMEDLLPSALANVLKSVRYATEGAKTMRGDPITSDMGFGSVMAQSIGFAPAEYTRQLEMNARLKGMHDYVVEKASNLKRKYYMASREHDTGAMQEYKQELLALGAKHPGLGISKGTINEALAKSMKAHKARTKEMVHGVTYSKKMMGEIQQNMEEWGE